MRKVAPAAAGSAPDFTLDVLGRYSFEAGAGLALDVIFFVFLFVYFRRDEQDVNPVPRERFPGGGESSPEL